MEFAWVISYAESYFPYQGTWILYESSPMWQFLFFSSSLMMSGSRRRLAATLTIGLDLRNKYATQWNVVHADFKTYKTFELGLWELIFKYKTGW